MECKKWIKLGYYIKLKEIKSNFCALELDVNKARYLTLLIFKGTR